MSRLPFKPKFKQVTVYWDDPYCRSGWIFPDDTEFEPAIECVTRGYLVSEDKKRICVALSVTSQGTCGDVMVIPRHCVVKVVRR